MFHRLYARRHGVLNLNLVANLGHGAYMCPDEPICFKLFSQAGTFLGFDDQS
jgi:hypothetical protein